MYLRRVRYQDGDHYLIRRSFRDKGQWRYSDLIDLGSNPERFVEYTGGNGFYFDSSLEESLQACGEDSSEALEQLFFPFLKPHIRRIISRFQTPRIGQRHWERYSQGELLELQGRLHHFDKRRMHFLRCGRVDIGSLEGRPWKFLNILLEKSRDEIEHTIEGMESVLRPHEMRSYLFSALELEMCFPGHLLRCHPIALDQEKVEDYFLDALCQLNADEKFFSGVDPHDAGSLHPYLSKYVILYFDSSFDPHGWSGYSEEFMRRKPFQKRMLAGKVMDMDAACKVLGITEAEFLEMERKDLVRTYRKKAKELHPDRGGDKESFIQMTNAFECLLGKK